jgi:phage terminase large subunit-like protein
MAGRGYGKTRAGAEWVHEQARHFRYVSLVAPTLDEVRELQIEGESGLLATAPPWWRPKWNQNRRRLTYPNGCRVRYYTADEPERLRGKQHQRVWCEEPGSWRYPDAWDQLVLGLRLPPDPRCLVTGTPKPVRIVRQLVADPDCVVTTGTTYENVVHLADAFVEQVIRRYEGTRLGDQELLAQLLEDDAEAVVPRAWVAERCGAREGAETPAGLGVDVAGGGSDDCAMVLRVGDRYRLLRRWSEADTRVTTSIVAAAVREHGASYVNVDSVGIGQGVADGLRELARRGRLATRVGHVNFGAAADEPERFANLRAEAWWRGRELTEAGAWDLSALDEDALDELCAPHYSYRAGRVQVEPKDEVKRRLGRSPDVADALLLAALGPRGGVGAAAW